MKDIEIKTREEYLSVFDNSSEHKNVLIFKFSPICGISSAAEREIELWQNDNNGSNCALVRVDVIYRRELSQFIAKDLNVKHESPQLLWLDGNKNIHWVGSHYEINRKNLSEIK